MILTQSMLKDLENDQTCPVRWKGRWIDKEIPSEPNEHMLCGLFFESLALAGGSAHGEKTYDLPRLKNGNKSSKQLRIEEQAIRFKEMFDPEHPDFLGFHIFDDQVYLEAKGRGGTIDFMAEDEKGIACVFDLKLTSTLEWKDAWWYDISKLDLIQQYHYQQLYRDQSLLNRDAEIRNLLIIFDYTPRKNVVVYELFPDKDIMQAVDDRFNMLDEAIKLYNERGWITIPSIEECSMCPLECKDRIDDK